jgi:hypothetical protein
METFDDLCAMETFEDLCAIYHSVISKHKAVAFKKIGDPPYLGCELEVVFPSRILSLGCALALSFVKGIQLVREVTLSTYGFEIVTDPMNLKQHMILWKVLIPIIKTFQGYCDTSCGFHVHIDKTQISLKNVTEIFTYNDPKFLQSIGRRQSNLYCRPRMGYNKTCGANIGKKTIELRIFRCSLVYTTILRFLLFANKLMYTT